MNIFHEGSLLRLKKLNNVNFRDFSTPLHREISTNMKHELLFTATCICECIHLLFYSQLWLHKIIPWKRTDFILIILEHSILQWKIFPSYEFLFLERNLKLKIMNRSREKRVPASQTVDDLSLIIYRNCIV